MQLTKNCIDENKKEEIMTERTAIRKLKKLQESHDTEDAHDEADEILCSFLRELNYDDIVKEYRMIAKWYA